MVYFETLFNDNNNVKGVIKIVRSTVKNIILTVLYNAIYDTHSYLLLNGGTCTTTKELKLSERS